jgi:hypothetical protein
MAVSPLFLPFDIVSTISSYIPDENVLLISSINNSWRKACTHFDRLELYSHVLQCQCARTFLIINSDLLETQNILRIFHEHLIAVLFDLSVSNSAYGLFPNWKKNIFLAQKIIKCLKKKYPLIINREYFINKIHNSIADSHCYSDLN